MFSLPLRLPLGRYRTVLIVLSTLLLTVSAKSILSEKAIESYTTNEIEEKIQECDFAVSLAAHKLSTSPQTTSFTSKLFSYLFPSDSPAINALLATAYISGPPNFLLALCPPNIDPSSLSIMVAFAVGGLLGDTLFHLLPEIFLGEDEHDKVKFVVLEPNRNLLLGLGIMVGLVTFMGMDKALRIATGGSGGHDHSHAHANTPTTPKLPDSNGHASTTSSTSPTSKSGSTRKRKSSPSAALTSKPLPPTPSTSANETPINPSVKLAGLLNLIADFTHNITDGLALSSSFYASPALGATTTMAVFFHEIPHEVGDFALLIQSGFSKQKAMGAQFVTAVGAFLGTLIGIFVQEYGGNSSSATSPNGEIMTGIWGTSLTWGDMLLPFTAGTFLYVGTVAVIPELLETKDLEEGGSGSKMAELRKTGLQFLAMATGAAIMLAISWS